MTWFAVWIVLLLILYIFYRWSTKTYNTFKERGIQYQKPIPIFGNAFPFVLNQNFHKVMLKLYREHKDQKIYGFYNLRSPFFIINDRSLVKKMGIKEFETFPNHQPFFNSDSDPLFRGMLSAMKDQRWRDMRNTVTPLYTISKMRAMFTLMNECFEEALQYLHSNLDPETNSIELEMKEYFCRLSSDLIATTAFGLKVNSFEDRKNKFYTIGQTITRSSRFEVMKFIIFAISPKLFDLLGLKAFDRDASGYFIRLVVDAMRYREKHNILRPDMIQLLMEAKRESEHQWTDEEIVAQCFIFFFAAFQNNAVLLCTTCYEMADNMYIQQKLFEEVMETKKRLNGKTLDYDALKSMKYCEMALQESLRKWPLAAVTDRQCGKDFRVEDDDGLFICDLKKGDKVWFQIMGFQMDEEYFENPEVYDPERFSDSNKDKIKPLTYFPFGLGPRQCIGNRYAIMQAKAMLYYLIKDFKIERSPKLCKNLWEDVIGFTIVPKSGYWFKLIRRSNEEIF